MKTAKVNTRKLVVTAMISALSAVLMFLSFNVPLMPEFIKMDFSELPALITSFTIGPIYGVLVCLVKNLINITFTKTAGIGELSNFLLGASFVFAAGIIYKKMQNYKGAIISSIVGALVMALFSLISNYFIIYPLYSIVIPIEGIIGAYKIINPSVDGLFDALLIFNMPFTFIKGILVSVITIITYKSLLPFIRGRKY